MSQITCLSHYCCCCWSCDWWVWCTQFLIRILNGNHRSDTYINTTIYGSFVVLLYIFNAHCRLYICSCSLCCVHFFVWVCSILSVCSFVFLKSYLCLSVFLRLCAILILLLCNPWRFCYSSNQLAVLTRSCEHFYLKRVQLHIAVASHIVLTVKYSEKNRHHSYISNSILYWLLRAFTSDCWSKLLLLLLLCIFFLYFNEVCVRWSRSTI